MLLAVACVGAVVWGSRKIEAMEAYAVKFDSLRPGILAIGPPSLKAPDLRRRPLILTSPRAQPQRPSALSPTLQRLVADGSRYECNLKTRSACARRSNRVTPQRTDHPAARLMPSTRRLHPAHYLICTRYNGDAALVKDLCRGLVVAELLPALQSPCAALQKLADAGVLEILQVKNRLRDPPEGDGPTASGYRDLNVNIRFQAAGARSSYPCRTFEA